ncbi:MAG: hypothetical protein PHV36_14955 [Elusimicrobiales bacterium]|nr:hypothetical protein [Elusimicrobiales bacterium]
MAFISSATTKLDAAESRSLAAQAFISTATERLDTSSLFITTATSRLDANLAFISTATSLLTAHEAFRSTATARLDTSSLFITTATSRLDANLAFISTATSLLTAHEAFRSTATARLDTSSLFITTATSRLDANLAFISTATNLLTAHEAFRSTATARMDTSSLFITTATSRLDANLAFISTATNLLTAYEAFRSTATARLDTSSLFITTATSRLDANLAFISTATNLLTALEAFRSTATTAIDGKLGSGLTSAQIFVGNVSNQAAPVTMTGDITIDNAGVSAIGAGKVTFAQVGANTCAANEIMKRNPGNTAWICSADAGAGSGITLAPASADSDASANDSIFINSTAGGNLIRLQKGGSDRFIVNNTGAISLTSGLAASTMTLTDTAAPLLIKPSGAPSANTKLLDMQATGGGVTNFSVDSEGDVTANSFSGPLTGNVNGNASGTAATVTGAAQTNITSVGTLTGLTMGGTLAMGANNITMTGSLGATGAGRLTKGWFTDLDVTNAITGSVTGNAGTVTNGVYTGSDNTLTGNNTFTSATASPILIKPSGAPVANTKLFDMQATGAGVTNFSVDAEGDVIATSFSGSGAALTSLDAGNISAGTLTSARGGTGADLSAGAIGEIPYFSATGVMSVLPAGSLGFRLIGGGPGAAPTWSDPSVKTVTTRPLAPTSGTTAAVANASLTVRKVGLFNVPNRITVNQLSFGVGAVTTAGTYKICVYDEAGTTKLIDVTGATTIANSNDVAVAGVVLDAGNYYVAMGCATTCSNTVFQWTTVAVKGFNAATIAAGKTALEGTVTHTSGTCNASLGAITPAISSTPIIRFDN